VIVALGMEKPILVGNSCGGAILHSLGAEQPERLGGLVYLDAAEGPDAGQTRLALLVLSHYWQRTPLHVDSATMSLPLRTSIYVYATLAILHASAPSAWAQG
jgi:pimeloyl-ACP methyl ester carboxylesterase